jgi:Ni,Fe-hydrogenase III small subunit
VCHLHMGGWNGDALEWEALLSPRFLPRLRKIGVEIVETPAEADVLVVTGLLTAANLPAVLREIASMCQPSLVIAAGDAAIDGGVWAQQELPGLAPHPLSHYVDVRITVPGTPPTPQSIFAAINASLTKF